MLDITLKINDDVPTAEVSYILRQLSHDIDISGISFYCGRKRSIVRIFDSNGDPAGTASFNNLNKEALSTT